MHPPHPRPFVTPFLSSPADPQPTPPLRTGLSLRALPAGSTSTRGCCAWNESSRRVVWCGVSLRGRDWNLGPLVQSVAGASRSSPPDSRATPPSSCSADQSGSGSRSLSRSLALSRALSHLSKPGTPWSLSLPLSLPHSLVHYIELALCSLLVLLSRVALYVPCGSKCSVTGARFLR